MRNWLKADFDYAPLTVARFRIIWKTKLLEVSANRGAVTKVPCFRPQSSLQSRVTALQPGGLCRALEMWARGWPPRVGSSGPRVASRACPSIKAKGFRWP